MEYIQRLGDGADGGITAEGVRAIVSQDLLNAFESDSADEYSEYGSEISPNLPNPPLFMKCELSADKNADLYKAFGDGTTLAYIMTITSGESNIAASRIQIAFSAGGGTDNKILSRTRDNGTVAKWSEWKTLTGGGDSFSRFQVLVTNKNGNNEVPSTSPDANLSGMDQYLCSAEVIRRRINAAVSGIDLGKGEGVIISYKGAYDGLEGVTYYPGDVVTCEVGKSYYYGSTGTFLCFKQVENGEIQPPFGNQAVSTDEDGNIVWLNLTYNTLQIPNNAENGQHIEIVKDSYGHISTKAVNKTNIKTKINLNITQSQWVNNDTSPLNITVDKETYPHVYKLNWDGIYHDTPIAVFCQSEDVYKFAGTKTSGSYDTNAEVYIYSKTAVDVKINMLVASIGDSE